MPTFTTTLKRVNTLTGGHFGLDTYPIFDDSYRSSLNNKILDHFYNREIGQETIDMFRLAMRRKMNEIMPIYNQLYKSQLLAINPLLTFSTTSHSVADGTSSATTATTNSGTSTSSSDSSSRAVNSELPQVKLSGNEDYATSAADSIGNSTATGGSTESGNLTNTGTQGGTTDATASGFTQSQASLLLQYRETFLNIDMMVIGELEGLFMLVWDTGEASFGQGPSMLYPFYFGGF